MTRSKRNGTKLLAASIGGGALVAMGIFTAVVGGAPTSDGPASVAGPMTGGETVTEEAPATSTPVFALATAKAVPAVKAQAYK